LYNAGGKEWGGRGWGGGSGFGPLLDAPWEVALAWTNAIVIFRDERESVSGTLCRSSGGSGGDTLCGTSGGDTLSKDRHHAEEREGWVGGEEGTQEGIQTCGRDGHEGWNPLH